MRYLLVVGFACDVYRREPRARIFVGDQLVDEFSITHTPSSLWPSISDFQKKMHPLQPLVWAELDNLWMKNHPPLKFYELQFDKEINNLSLRIDIRNHDSNYSNGYMSRSTLIRLEVCRFFPLEQKLLRRLQKIKMRRRSSENHAWYNAWKNQTFDLVINGMHWQREDGKKITNSGLTLIRAHDIGGDGAFLCELSKKYGILMPTLARAWRHNFNYPITNYLFDKYQQHAHQRDTN